MRIRLVLPVVLLLILILLPSISSLECSVVTNTSCTDSTILYLKNDTGGYNNAHAALANYTSDYPYVLCCDADVQQQPVYTNCSLDYALNFLSLSNETNAHVQNNTNDTYNYDACIAIPKYTLDAYYRNQSCEGSEVCLLSMSSQGNAHVANCSYYDTQVCINVTYSNNPPVVTFINISPEEPDTQTDLNCSFVVEDEDVGDTLSANISWYINGSLAPAYDISMNVTNGTLNYTTLDWEETTHFDNWSCVVTPYDSYNYGESNSSDNLTIINTPPTIPTRLTPTDGNDTLTNRKVNFTWSASSDVDNDDIYYLINVTHDTKFNISENTTNLWYADQTELFTYEETYHVPYYWKIKACDEYDACSEWTTPLWNFSIMDVLWIEIVNDFVDFGMVGVSQVYSTIDPNYNAFSFENIGNVKADLMNITATNLWSTVDLDTKYLQGKTNHTLGSPPYEEASTLTEWFNISNGNYLQNLIEEYDYDNSTNELLFDIKVEVPSFEDPGSKTTTLTYYWTVS